MSFFNSMDVAASAMTAERQRMDIVSQNIANANTQNTISGTPYRRQVACIQAGETQPFALPAGLDDDDKGVKFQGSGVKASVMTDSSTPFRMTYDPGNPNAIKDGPQKGYVMMPNVNIISEMTDLIAASRAYEANATAVEAAKGLAMKGLEIGTR